MTKTVEEIEREHGADVDSEGIDWDALRRLLTSLKAHNSSGIPVWAGLMLLAMRDELVRRDAVDEDAVQRWVAIFMNDFPEGLTLHDISHNWRIAEDVQRQMEQGYDESRVRLAAWKRIAAARTPEVVGEKPRRKPISTGVELSQEQREDNLEYLSPTPRLPEE